MSAEETDEGLRRLFERIRVIAVVGASPSWDRPSCAIMQYLKSASFRIVPVNPNIAGQTILDEPVHGRLSDIPVHVDLVDIFRKPEAVGAVVEEAIAIGAGAVWMQKGVRDAATAMRARKAGLTVVIDRCIKTEHARLFGRASGESANRRAADQADALFEVD